MDYVIIALALCGFFSAYVAVRKGRNPVAWWLVGAFLPVVGPVLSLTVPPKLPADEEEEWAPGAPVPHRPVRRPKRCCGFYIPDCCGCPHFRRQLFDSTRTEHAKGRCDFYGKDLETSPENADSRAHGAQR
jgi:hypothetical protein